MSGEEHPVIACFRYAVKFVVFLTCLLPSQSLCVQDQSPGGEKVVRWTYDEEWRRGTSEDELFFGMIVAVCQGPDGNLYLLDAQRNQVFVIDWSGEHLRTLGHEGDGPAEFRRPVAMEFMDEETLGVVQRIPGKVICMDLDGNPQGIVSPGGTTGGEDGGFCQLTGIRSRGGTRVFCGEENRSGRTTQFLSVVDIEGGELHRLLNRPRERLFETRLYIEKNEDFVAHGRWGIGPNGNIYTAPQRDRYLVEIHDSRGERLRSIERPCKARKRSQDEMDEIRDAYVMMIDGQRVRIDSEIEMIDPCIEQLRITDDGELWVLSSKGARDPLSGIFATWDIFAADGLFIHRLELDVPGDPGSDRLVLLSGERAVLLKGFVQAGRAVRPRLAGETKEETPDDVAHFVIGLRRVQ